MSCGVCGVHIVSHLLCSGGNQLGPSDQLNVNYSYAPLFAQAGRTLIGGDFRLEGREKRFGGALLYESRGWQRWRGRLSALTPSGVVRTPDDEGWLFVMPAAAIVDLDGELTCDWRDGDLW